MQIDGPHFRDTIDALQPDQHITRKYHFGGGDGSLAFSAKIEGQTITGVIEGYVTNGLGGQKRLILLQDQQYRIENEKY